MSFKTLFKKYNTKWDIPYTDYISFKTALRDDLTVDELYDLLSKLYKVDKSVFDDFTPENLNDLTSKLFDIIQSDTPLVNRFRMNGKDYGLIPNFSKITAGELIDMDNLFANDDITSLMSILYRPIEKYQWNPFGIFGQKRYIIEKYKEPDFEGFRNVPLHIVDGALSFFLSSCQTLR